MTPSERLLDDWATAWSSNNSSKDPERVLPATGERFSSVRGSSILELEAGKIRRESDYWDAATFMKQVGLLPSQ